MNGQNREIGCFGLDENIQRAVTDILKDHYKLIDQRRSRSGADPWIIALARVERAVVLTGEKPTRKENRPHIPDVCEAIGIRWINMLQLFREQKWKFHS